MTHSENASGRLEGWIGGVILLSLAAIAAGVLLKQSSFNPAVLVSRNLMQHPAAGAEASQIVWIPDTVKEFGAPEHFTPDNLYDKIDGKAELYVSAGVVAMHCQRFVMKDAPDDWLEWFIYDMGKVPQAFSVFSTQRRAEGQSLELTEYAYKTPNALFFVSSSNYVEAVASSTNQPLMDAILEIARHFVASGSADGNQMTELQMLPSDRMVPGSATLQATDAFGFDQFKNVFTAQYRLDGADAIAFVISCSSPEAANALRDAYRAFLVENGGKAVASSIGSELGMPIEIVGAFEMVFSRGKVVAGVHAGSSLAATEELARSLNQRLAANAP